MGMSAGQDHDDAEFTRLWTRALPQVESLVHAVVRASADADDLVQETAVACFRNFASYDSLRPFAGWAMGIARHKINDHWRRLGRQGRGISDPHLLETLIEVQAEMGDELDHLRSALRRCLEEIRGRQREILERFYQQGQEASEIASATGLEAGHVRVMLHRVRCVLRQCVERQGATS